MVMTFSGWKPGSTARKRRKLLSIKPAPASKTSASAISDNTRAQRRASWRPVKVRPAWPSDSRSPLRVAWKAGARPNTIPVINEMPNVNASTQPSIRIISMRAIFPAGAKAIKAGTPQTASKTPDAPPARATSALSVSNCRISRQRPAPRAARTAISSCLPDARARSRLATFAHAISSTNPTAPAKITSDARMLATKSSFRGRTCATQPFLSSPGARKSWCARVSSSACASWRETPGFNRPTTGLLNELCESIRTASGVHACASYGKPKPGGMMPMTLWPTPSSFISFPRTRESAPKRSRQSSSLSTTTWSRPGWSSSARKPLPMAGFTRRTGKKSGVTLAVRMRTGSPAPVRLAPLPVNEAKRSNSPSARRNSR